MYGPSPATFRRPIPGHVHLRGIAANLVAFIRLLTNVSIETSGEGRRSCGDEGGGKRAEREKERRTEADAGRRRVRAARKVLARVNRFAAVAFGGSGVAEGGGFDIRRKHSRARTRVLSRQPRPNRANSPPRFTLLSLVCTLRILLIALCLFNSEIRPVIASRFFSSLLRYVTTG